jgi:hypothetical protein
MTSTETAARGHEDDARADHRPYITAVAAALVAGDIGVAEPVITSDPLGRRTATLTLQVDPEDSVYHEDVQLFLEWDEENGWGFVTRTHGGAEVDEPIFHGFGAVLDPQTFIVPWVATLVTVPHIEGSRQDGPYRQWRQRDPAFESALEAYATTPPAE